MKVQHMEMDKKKGHLSDSSKQINGVIQRKERISGKERERILLPLHTNDCSDYNIDGNTKHMLKDTS